MHLIFFAVFFNRVIGTSILYIQGINRRTHLLRLREPNPLRLRPGGEVPEPEVPLPPLVLRGGAGHGRDQEAVQHRGHHEEAEHADGADLERKTYSPVFKILFSPLL